MWSNKKADFDPIQLLGKVVLVLLILIILSTIIVKFFPNLIKVANCEDRNGKCVEKSVGCSEDQPPLIGLRGCGDSQVCCQLAPGEQTPSEKTFTNKEMDALQNAIILTLNKDTNPITDRATINLKEGMNYTFHIKLNDKLLKEDTKAKIGYCAVYVTDSREDGKKYLLTKAGPKLIEPSELFSPEELMDCSMLTDKNYVPSMLDSYKDLMLYIILFDSEVKTAYDNVKKELVTSWSDSGFLVPSLGMTGALAELDSMYSNTDHWLAMRAYRLNVEPVVKISGLSGTWVNKDDITISCTDVTCKNFGLALVKLKDNNYEQMAEECKTLGDKFTSTLDYVTGSSIKTSGIPLNLDIGGFRIPTSKQKVVYQTAQKKIAVVENKASVLIDRATMLKSFYSKNNDEQLFIGDNTYLCVEATLQDNSTVYALSKTPLRLDILPPFIDQENGVQVIYPDEIQGSLTGTDISGALTNYYYNQYPKVRITGCYDYDQSGCVNYDYYIHTGNFVNLGSVTSDWQTGVKAVLLTKGLNLLLQELAAQDPLNTICPFITSTEYARNSNQEIRFTGEGQGIMCIRVTDKAGNSEVYWKELWTPDEMFKSIAADALANATS